MRDRLAIGARVTVEDGDGKRPGPLVAKVTDGDATWALHNSDYSFWSLLRTRLETCELDPQTIQVVDSYEEGATDSGEVVERGVLLTTQGRIIRYCYSYKDESWGSWDDISDGWRETSFEPAIRAALRNHP